MFNMVLRNRKEERLRIIWISENEDNLYIINIDDNKWQYIFKVSDKTGAER